MPTKHLTLHQALDEAPLSLFHYKAMLTAGIGFFTDAYDLFIIGAAITIIKLQWHLSPVEIGLLGSSTLIATFAGAFIFGHLADKLGRKAVYGLEAIIMAVSALASAFSPNFIVLIILRIILGFGIGGDYPVSGVIMSEYSNRANRGKMVSLVFSMQALGLIIGPVVALTLLASGINHDLAWRIMLGLGALPALGVIYFRRTLPESPRFLASVKGKYELAAKHMHKFSGGIVHATVTSHHKVTHSFKSFITKPRNLVLLLGTAGSWFLLDYAYYGNTISTPLVLKTVAPNASLIQSAAWSLIIFAVAAAPGYIASFSLIDRIGHKRLQWIGFIVMGICFALIGIIPGITHSVLPFLFLYGLSYFFTEFGPNETTFVIPTEVFSVNGRTTGHGISAGIGKVGAFIGVFAFPLLNAHLGLGGTLLLSGGFSFAGALLTIILPEVSGKSLEEESEKAAVYTTGKPAYLPTE
ncbi:MAG: MFS transporter [Patescibacteria group bacterium]|nr:MFS transporter [Patescibacteria group bacterium]